MGSRRDAACLARRHPIGPDALRASTLDPAGRSVCADSHPTPVGARFDAISTSLRRKFAPTAPNIRDDPIAAPMNPLPFPRLALGFADRVTDRFGPLRRPARRLVAGLASACLAPHCLAEEPPGSDAKMPFVKALVLVDVEVVPHRPGGVGSFVLGTSLTSAAEYFGFRPAQIFVVAAAVLPRLPRPLQAQFLTREKQRACSTSAVSPTSPGRASTCSSRPPDAADRPAHRRRARRPDFVDYPAGLPDIRKTVFARLSASIQADRELQRADSKRSAGTLLGRGS